MRIVLLILALSIIVVFQPFGGTLWDLAIISIAAAILLIGNL